MRRREALPELLLPAGDFECLVAAVAAGADAVYVGGKSYSARAYAKNFDIDELSSAVSYCHLHGVKLYVTLNTLLYNGELDGALDFARELYRIGVDALIVADLGLVRVLRAALPELELHASTQMSVHNTLGADVAYSLGCKRVVLARELSAKDIRSVTDSCLAEVEIFLHGALCVSYSGQCLFSSLVGGRSGNRGECAQPCRLPYNGGCYPLSLKDLSLAEHIPELIESGVASLKVEGRMKSPDYVYTVGRIYRRLLDENRVATADEKRELMRAFSRDGFTDAYFEGHPEKRMTGVRTEADKADSREASGGDFSPVRVRVFAKVSLHLGEKSEMTLYTEGRERCVTVYGDEPMPARNAPLNPSDVRARLSKMGNTHLALAPDDIELSLDEGINLSPASLNALRRSAASALELPLNSSPLRDMPALLQHSSDADCKSLKTAIFYRIKSFNRWSGEGFDIAFIPLWLANDIECRRTPDGIAMPPVITDGEMETVREMLRASRDKGIRYALVENLGQIELAREYGFTPMGDFRLNIMNSYARDAYYELGLEKMILSPELTVKEAKQVGGGLIVYGRIPLMLTERCFMRENYGCRNCSEVGLTDRRGVEFPMVREFEHRNLIFNSAVTYIADKPDAMAPFSHRHFIFSTESESEISEIVRAYENGSAAPSGVIVRRIGKRDFKK